MVNGSGIMPLNSPGGSTLQWDEVCWHLTKDELNKTTGLPSKRSNYQVWLALQGYALKCFRYLYRVSGVLLKKMRKL